MLPARLHQFYSRWVLAASCVDLVPLQLGKAHSGALDPQQVQDVDGLKLYDFSLRGHVVLYFCCHE